MKIGDNKMKLLKQLKSKVTKKVKHMYTKVSKSCARHGMHLEITKYSDMVDFYFMISNVGIHVSLSRKPSCLLSFTIGLDNVSLILANLTLSVTYVHY